MFFVRYGDYVIYVAYKNDELLLLDVHRLHGNVCDILPCADETQSNCSGTKETNMLDSNSICMEKHILDNMDRTNPELPASDRH